MKFTEMMEAGIAATGLSQAKLSKELGMAQITLSRTKHGECVMSEATLRRFAARTNLDPDKLVIASSACFPEGSARRRVGELLAENRQMAQALVGEPEKNRGVEASL